MNSAKIEINDNGLVTIVPLNGTVWLSIHEIANLFDVFSCTITANIKVILKSGVLRKEDVFKEIEVSNGYQEVYNLEMIIALSFRIKSLKTQILRKWMIKKISVSSIPLALMKNIQQTDKYYLN